MLLKKKSFMLFLASYFLVNTIISQNLTQTVKGRIIEQQTNIPLIGVNITLLNSNPLQGTSSDENGYFELKNIPVGRANFKFSTVGFEDFYASEVIITSAKETILNIQMIESFGELEEVVLKIPKDRIKSNNKLATVSARSFNVEETKRFPSSINDPARMAQSFSGVTSNDDATNEIIVRGNPSNQLQWRIEGMEVPTPSHFTGTGNRPGTISMLNNNLLGKSDFFTGAFLAEYGNATAGVFDINLRNGNTDTNEYAFQLGVLGTDISAEGPFNKNYKGSYLVNYRYSTLSLLNRVVEISKDGTPKYQDVSFKLYFPISNTSHISVWGIGGLSEEDKKKNKVVINNETEEEKTTFESATFMTGITYTTSLNKLSKIDVRASVSGTYSDVNYQRFGITNSNTLKTNTENYENTLQFSANYYTKFSPQTSLKTGTRLSFLGYNINNNTNQNNIITTSESSDHGVLMSQTYAQIKHRFTEKLSATVGLHGTHLAINNNTTIEPRLGLEWKIKTKHKLSFGLGMHSRSLPIRQYFTNSEENKHLKLTKAIHYVLSYDWRVIKNGHLKTEIYYQGLNNIAVTANTLRTNASVNGRTIYEKLISTGIGRNYGIDFMFEKFFSNNYYYLLSASLYDSKYKASNGNWYNSTFNYNYASSIVGGKEFTLGKSNNTIMGVNLKMLFSGGRRGTPRTVNGDGDIVLNQDLRNSLQFKDFLRLDTSIYANFNRPKVTHSVSIDIQNVTNRENIEQAYNSPINNNRVIDTQLGLVPVINYKIEF